MSKRSIEAKKKKRLEQLRDAQRRRREKLKNDSRHFVQIILPESTLQNLRIITATTGETMQQAIARLVLVGLENSPTDLAQDSSPAWNEEADTLESEPVTQQAPTDDVEPEVEPHLVIPPSLENITAEMVVETSEFLENNPEPQPETSITALASAPPPIFKHPEQAVAKASDQLDLFG